MDREPHNGLQCSQFEAFLAQALDGALSAEEQQRFEAHARSCAACGPLLAETREGLLWLKELGEVEPPKNLVHNILAATTMKEETRTAALPAVAEKSWRQHLYGFTISGFLRSRFVTSFGMAFFSLSLTLTLAGVRLSDLAKVDWHPTALYKSVAVRYAQVEARAVRYYENMRLVYEVESKVRELKKAATPEDNNDKKQKQEPKDPDNTSGQPRQGYTVLAAITFSGGGVQR